MIGMKLLLMIFIVLISGCAAPQLQGRYELYQNQQVNASFVQQYDKLVVDWNYIAGMKMARTLQGFVIYFDSRINITNQSCDGKMMPTFNCSDLLLEEEPAEGELREGDVVSFEIFGNESSLFGEDAFSGNRIIQRRIYRIGNDSSRYFVMKKDSSDTTHKTLVRFDRIKGRIIGFIFDAQLERNLLEPYTSLNRTIADYNELVERWNKFIGSVYAATMPHDHKIYYDRQIEVPSLACTGSMQPTVDCNDLIFAYQPGSERALVQGDVISFRIAPNETSGFLEPPTNETIHVMHRIFRITQIHGQIAFITKGDNPESNRQTDAIYLTFDRVDTKTIGFFKDSFNTTYKKK